MPEDTYNPDQAAPVVDVSASTIRNWCRSYAGLLSDGANPKTSKERRLTQKDLATLQAVKQLRDSGKSQTEILEVLQAAASRNNTPTLTIDVPATVPPAPQNAPEARTDDFAAPVLYQAMQSQIEGLRREQDAQQRQLDQLRAQAKTAAGMFAVGVLTGVFLVLVLVAVWTLLGL
jgi:DNA-binding transcriptional MerR regulator